MELVRLESSLERHSHRGTGFDVGGRRLRELGEGCDLAVLHLQRAVGLLRDALDLLLVKVESSEFYFVESVVSNCPLRAEVVGCDEVCRNRPIRLLHLGFIRVLNFSIRRAWRTSSSYLFCISRASASFCCRVCRERINLRACIRFRETGRRGVHPNHKRVKLPSVPVSPLHRDRGWGRFYVG